jgi:hypothetical protein
VGQSNWDWEVRVCFRPIAHALQQRDRRRGRSKRQGDVRRELAQAGRDAGLPDKEAVAAVAWGLKDGATRPLEWRTRRDAR